ncbi:hypothetical protein KIN20_033228 [Parelaphostrongylus tenuis]|uniref:UBA domain-containing protein n=1 Tax=Parelaphostrongylus tenuis TaxID=148309 RepID=A0AAD5WIL9_PARTN|nr:hypothetical protein KIN20_033228 [Parelaphostrongylus tenuis]
MLVRDPSKRAVLAEIVSNAWVMAGDRGHAAALPLIVKHHLSHSAHTTIIEQMVKGGVGSEEAILRALENDEYNSMTATYYLLAERVLATYREEQAKELMSKKGSAVPEEDLLESASRTFGISQPTGSRCRSRSNSWRARPCAILKEESEEELTSYLRSSRQSSRNSSPSVSMFTNTRERVSPQAIHDLLELCRLGGRRAMSPESIRSSQSPSPPSSSGRSSPAVSSISSLSRLKLSSSSFSGGMRKLSSSPHLLGICEEGEDTESLTTPLPVSRQVTIRANRSSASTGLVHIRHGTAQSTKMMGPHSQPTYSSVRMIRPRRAVVSPDVCKRYDQHQRPSLRSRCSTSCSSSEASDDEEGKRLSLLGSKYCGRKPDSSNDGDDRFGGQGGIGGGSSGDVDGQRPATSGASLSTTSRGELLRERRSDGASEECYSGRQHLFAIPEATLSENIRSDDSQSKLFHERQIPERITQLRASKCDLAGKFSSFANTQVVTDSAAQLSIYETSCGLRILTQAYPYNEMFVTECMFGDNDSVFDARLETISSSRKDAEEQSTDSGCSSEKGEMVSSRQDIYKICEFSSKPLFNKLLFHDQPLREKVNSWLCSAHFA